MKIKVDKVSDAHYRADCLDLPGSPPVGTGETPEMALACLFWLIIFDSTLGPDPSNWIRYLDKDEPLWINDKVWIRPPFTRGVAKRD